MEARELSLAFVEAYNERDARAIRSLLAADVDYVRPGPKPLGSVDEIMAQYEHDWRTYDATIDVRRVVEVNDLVVIELTLTSGDGRITVEAMVLHRWASGRMVEYRLYLDAVPA